MSAVRLELMASAVGHIGGVAWHHLYLVATEASGAQRYLRAGPQCLPLAQFAGRRTEHGEALEDYVPSPAGPYGVIVFASGAYEPGGVDFDPAAANMVLASGPDAEKLWQAVQAAAKALGDEQIPYDPVEKGANWALMEALRRCGVEAELPPKRWAPGAGRSASETPAPAVSVSTRRIGQAIIL